MKAELEGMMEGIRMLTEDAFSLYHESDTTTTWEMLECGSKT